jgi:alanyl-tRNA synthetase
VDSEKFRFDFSSKRGLEVADVAKTEHIVGQIISQNLPVYAQTAPLQLAKEINGLLLITCSCTNHNHTLLACIRIIFR